MKFKMISMESRSNRTRVAIVVAAVPRRIVRGWSSGSVCWSGKVIIVQVAEEVTNLARSAGSSPVVHLAKDEQDGQDQQDRSKFRGNPEG